MKITIGTRGSQLALWQAHYIQAELQKIGVEAVLKIIQTKGDKIQHLSFDKIEGKGFFTKELEEELLNGEIDLAVHSMKDLPTTQPAGLRLAAVSYRENPSDWLLIHKDALDINQPFRLKANALVGTSSARRKTQLLDFRPDIQLTDLRGNVPTRVQKLADKQLDAIMLAGAGLSRLNLDLSAFEVIKFSPKEFIPAPAQGVLALQIRTEDKLLHKTLLQLHCYEVGHCTNVERSILKLFGGGCHLPLGAYCEYDGNGNFHVWAMVADSTTGLVQRARLSSSSSSNLAERVVQLLQTPK